MKTLLDTFQCNNCGCIHMDREDVLYCSFIGNREEPPEYEVQCPECGTDDVEEESAFYCRTCEDVMVSDDGEQCPECHTCEAEALYDSMRENY